MNLKLKTLTLLSCVALFAGCSGNNLVATDTGELQFSVVHHLNDGSELAADAEGNKTFVNDLGYTVKLTEAKVNWKSIKLISDGDDPECLAGNDQDLEINSSQDFLGEDLISHLLGDHEVPMVAYCAYELTLAPGAEAAAIKNHEGEDHGGGNSSFPESFHLAGTWTKDAANGDFHIDTTDPVVIGGAFHTMQDGEMVEHPLHFHDGETSLSLLFGTKYDVLLNGVDFQAQDEDAQREQVLANLPNAVHQHLGATHDAGADSH
ncbi:MAG: hypothetical protein IT572_00800 [Deltaproteobacteria bacterium]|nr:hypothetical protein [Deltaproteobacteria bacterium]